jgi:hypothetical protein
LPTLAHRQTIPAADYSRFFPEADSGAATGPQLTLQQVLARRVPSVFILTHGD